jgi:DNA-binding NarL/FixJ family response regulator
LGTTAKILVVDDHPLLREGIAAIMINQTDIELVAEASNGREAIEKRTFQARRLMIVPML